MTGYNKGKQSRNEIINSAREIFNTYGIQITLAKLAELMNTTLGRLTHHFKNKDLLFIAIAQDYEMQLAELRKQKSHHQITMDTFVDRASAVMDLQYDYRCAVRYIVSSLMTRDEIKIHLQETYMNNRNNIKKLIEALVHVGMLQPRVLDDDIYEIFLFQLTNLFTNWVINLELYDVNKEYAEAKPVYLKGIVFIFLPFLTEQGKQELEDNGILKT